MNSAKTKEQLQNDSLSLERDEEKRKDDAVMALIQGLNFLIAQAADVQLGTAARVLHKAKEKLVYWAVDMNFEESTQDQKLNQHLITHHIAEDDDMKYAALKDKKLQHEILTVMMTSKPATHEMNNSI